MAKTDYAIYESPLPNRSRADLAKSHSDSNISSSTTLNNNDNNNGGGGYKNQVGDTAEDILVIGIDFGTTCSGVAWATVADFAGDAIKLVSWPYSDQEEGKVPTELHYENGKVMWGYDIPLEVEPVRWFKLLLVKDEDLSAELRESESLIRARKYLRQTRKRAVDLIADYLRALFQHTLHTIQKARGESVVDALRFHVVITVPAIWKDYARQGMGEAARLAGIMDFRSAGQTILTFAPEPEAAALSTLSEPGRNPKKDEVFIICDAGGGTVDLISYEVTNSKPLAIEEAVEGTGRLCGGIFIDEAFETACRDRIVRQWSHLSPHGIKEIMQKWEVGIKSQFNPGDQHKEYPIGIPAEAFKGSTSSLTDLSKQPLIRNGRIHFQESHIKKTFADSFKGIDELVDNQLSMARRQGLKVTGIILVGGLGSSPYLYEHLKAKYSGPTTSILQSGGTKPKTAICRGAVYKGFLEGHATFDEKALAKIETPIKVTSTVSRSSYGIKYSIVYDPMKHRREDRMWDDLEKKWMATNQMKWYLQRGDVVSKKDPVREKYYELYRRMGDFDGKLNVTLWTCEENEPPERKDFRVNSQSNFQMKVEAKFSELPDFKTASGIVVKKLTYEIEMIPSGASLDIAVYMNGEKLGSQNASVQFV
ncbi:Heat shock 70 kDa protein 12B [Colletotrichum siamense]|uniref:Heat shock 70 kDa protein 12B n=1 Tax=Colletotrichum siamense TaxID=690259 RepID=UPI001872B227|nr:Heat shock 70 kDa protein 12B [Colletotrichum siamense]KAF5516035.1 Heat shock 70 kDa protein 12B [Colletotrichum siamense]